MNLEMNLHSKMAIRFGIYIHVYWKYCVNVYLHMKGSNWIIYVFVCIIDYLIMGKPVCSQQHDYESKDAIVDKCVFVRLLSLVWQ